MGHNLSDNRHGLIASAIVTLADGHAEREAAKTMICDARQVVDDDREITLGADNGYDAREFIEALEEMNVVPHVAPEHVRPMLGRAGCDCRQWRLHHFTAKAQADRTGIWLGQDDRADSTGDGAWTEESRSIVCADYGRLQPDPHAHPGTNPCACGVRS